MFNLFIVRLKQRESSLSQTVSLGHEPKRVAVRERLMWVKSMAKRTKRSEFPISTDLRSSTTPQNARRDEVVPLNYIHLI